MPVVEACHQIRYAREVFALRGQSRCQGPQGERHGMCSCKRRKSSAIFICVEAAALSRVTGRVRKKRQILVISCAVKECASKESEGLQTGNTALEDCKALVLAGSTLLIPSPTLAHIDVPTLSGTRLPPMNKTASLPTKYNHLREVQVRAPLQLAWAAVSCRRSRGADWRIACLRT